MQHCELDHPCGKLQPMSTYLMRSQLCATPVHVVLRLEDVNHLVRVELKHALDLWVLTSFWGFLGGFFGVSHLHLLAPLALSDSPEVPSKENRSLLIIRLTPTLLKFSSNVFKLSIWRHKERKIPIKRRLCPNATVYSAPWSQYIWYNIESISIENSYPWQYHFDQVSKSRLWGEQGTVNLPASIKD